MAAILNRHVTLAALPTTVAAAAAVQQVMPSQVLHQTPAQKQIAQVNPNLKPPAQGKKKKKKNKKAD